MTSVDDSPDNIGGMEKINTLWKQYNNLINTLPASYASNEEIPFKNNIISNNILNENIPNNILVSNNTLINVEVPNSNNVEITIKPSDISYLTVDYLDTLFDNCSNILIGSKCNFENFGYKHIEFFYKKECYPTIYNTVNQIYTWFIPDPSNGDIKDPNTNNLLNNTIPYLYDPYYFTYKTKLFYKNSSNDFITINFASNPDFAYLDNKSGFLYFYGGTRTGNSVVLNNIRSQQHSNPSPPYISYIKYSGNTGFNNLKMTGNIIIDGSLNLINDISYNDISNNNYNILNTKQIKEYIENFNLTKGANNKLFQDASFNNIDVCGNLKIKDEIVTTKNYIDNNFTLLSLFNDLSLSHSNLNQIVSTISGSDTAIEIVNISNDIISISGRIENIKNIINNLDVSYVRDIDFELSYNEILNSVNNTFLDYLEYLNYHVRDTEFLDLSSNFYILENSFNNLDINYEIDNNFINRLNNVDTSLSILDNRINNIGTSDFTNEEVMFNNIDICGILNINKENLNNYKEYLVTVNYVSHLNQGVYFIDNIQYPVLFFEIGKIYRFNQSDSTNNHHPLRFYTNINETNLYTNNVIINEDSGTTNSYIEIKITKDTPKLLYYFCAHHSNMGNKIIILPNISNKSSFDISNLTTDTNNIQDLSSIFYNTIIPTKLDSKILININATLFCSYALEERISVELWRDNSMISFYDKIGSVTATGGLTIPYNITFLDEPNKIIETKYYLKYILENNNSRKYQGLININSNQYSGSSNIILRELLY